MRQGCERPEKEHQIKMTAAVSFKHHEWKVINLHNSSSYGFYSSPSASFPSAAISSLSGSSAAHKPALTALAYDGSLMHTGLTSSHARKGRKPRRGREWGIIVEIEKTMAN